MLGLRNIFLIGTPRKFAPKNQISNNFQYRTHKIEISILSCIFIPVTGLLMALIKVLNKALK